MKKFILILSIFCTFYNISFSQSGQWIWMKGDNVQGSPGNFGTIGVSSPTNEPPGRYQCAYWIDLQGNFWVFGGTDFNSNVVNDLWKYNPTTNEWTWMKGPQGIGNPAGIYGTKGVPSLLNYPEAAGYGANCWTDAVGDLWLFGGYNAVIGEGGNIWRYQIATNEWTWMQGDGAIPTNPAIYGPLGVYNATNSPGGRQEIKSGWAIGNELWLFGGQTGLDSKNDLWSYSIPLNQWAWQGGGQGINSPGNYGTLGVAAATNQPPGRFSYTKWKDASGALYTFAGGNIFTNELRNDVWKYDPATKLWTWVSGANTANDPGTTNTYCVPNVNDIPKSRIENQTAQTASTCVNAFWTFGGFNETGTIMHNDLWLFNTDNNEWTKVSGESMTVTVPASDYGTKGVAAPTNMIPPRGGVATWSDALGNLWVFGGGGGQNGTFGYLNDLWKFIPDTACFNTGIIGGVELTPPAQTTLCPGDTIHYLLPGNATFTISPATNNTLDALNNVIHIYGGGTYTVTATSLNPNDPCFLNDTITFTITGFAAPNAAFDVTPQVAIIGQGNFSFVNQSSNALSYEWYYKGNLISTNTDIMQTITELGVHCFDLVAIGNCGLKDTVQHCVEVLEDGSIFFPNAFSPNGDTKNETFGPVLKGNINLKSFLIFNRFGENVYKHVANGKGWDGKYKGEKCEIGVYYYVAEVENAFKKKVIYKGDVTLLY